jgi:hypothetical protein
MGEEPEYGKLLVCELQRQVNAVALCRLMRGSLKRCTGLNGIPAAKASDIGSFLKKSQQTFAAFVRDGWLTLACITVLQILGYCTYAEVQ